jgi:amino-acid N-acetyltransferase
MKNGKPPRVRAIAVRKARMGDIEPIYGLITKFSRREAMLPRSRADLYESLRDFVVADHKGRVIGCGALTIEWDNLAEIKSLAVAGPYQRRGLGRRLVKACLAEARRLGIGKVFALTSSPAFFDHVGFERVDRETLPHKVWSDCLKCPKFPDCDEVAVAVQMPQRKTRA